MRKSITNTKRNEGIILKNLLNRLADVIFPHRAEQAYLFDRDHGLLPIKDTGLKDYLELGLDRKRRR